MFRRKLNFGTITLQNIYGYVPLNGLLIVESFLLCFRVCYLRNAGCKLNLRRSEDRCSCSSSELYALCTFNLHLESKELFFQQEIFFNNITENQRTLFKQFLSRMSLEASFHKCSMKKLQRKISHNSSGITCARVSFL